MHSPVKSIQILNISNILLLIYWNLEHGNPVTDSHSRNSAVGGSMQWRFSRKFLGGESKYHFEGNNRVECVASMQTSVLRRMTIGC